MALTTGNFAYYYGTEQPLMTGSAALTGPIGGSGDTGSGGNAFIFSTTGLIPTGQSNLAGAGSDIWYAKVFVRHEGTAGELMTNPQLYVSNENISDQVQIALDPYWTGAGWSGTVNSDSGQSGTAANRRSLPEFLVTGDFVNYRGDSPLIIDDVATSSLVPVSLDSGDSIGFWIKIAIPAGLSSSYTNSFNVVLRGEV